MDCAGRRKRSGIHQNGVEFLADKISEEDNVIIHDGIRPLIDADVLTDVIDVCNRYGNAVTSLPYNEQFS